VAETATQATTSIRTEVLAPKAPVVVGSIMTGDKIVAMMLRFNAPSMCFRVREISASTLPILDGTMAEDFEPPVHFN